MRVLLVARSKFPFPPEHLPALFQGFTAWRAQYKDRMEGFYFFAGENGGCGILNVPDEAFLNRMMLEWPLAPFSDVQMHPLVDGDVALQQWNEAIQSMAASQV